MGSWMEKGTQRAQGTCANLHREQTGSCASAGTVRTRPNRREREGRDCAPRGRGAWVEGRGVDSPSHQMRPQAC